MTRTDQLSLVLFPAQSVGNTVTEDIKLPDKIAATLSGRTGNDDQFSRIQNETGCKLAMSRDSG